MKNLHLLEQAKQLMRADYTDVNLGVWGFCIAGYVCRAAGKDIAPVVDGNDNVVGHLTTDGVPIWTGASRLLGLDRDQSRELFITSWYAAPVAPGTPEYVEYACGAIDQFLAKHGQVVPEVPGFELEPEYELAGVAG